jgi:transposase
MRGEAKSQGAAFSYVSLEQRVPADHPLRAIRRMVDEVLRRLSPVFDELYAEVGRPSIPPEYLLRALLLQMFYSIRSERLLMEQLHYNLLFRWFVGLAMDDAVWVPTVFTKNRDRLLAGAVAQEFLAEVVAMARREKLLSDEHFTVDGTLIEAWASQKSFQPKDGTPPRAPGDFHGEKRSNATHASTTDPQARLYRRSKGSEAKLAYLGHVVVDNRHRLVVGGGVTPATGTAEREAAVAWVEQIESPRRITLGADKAYDTADFVAALRAHQVTPHVAQNAKHRRSAIDGRTTHHEGYRISQALRALIEQVPSWLKNVAPLRKVKLRGTAHVGWSFTLGLAAYDLVRMRRLLSPT